MRGVPTVLPVPQAAQQMENPPKPSTGLESGAAVSHNALWGPICWFETSGDIDRYLEQVRKQLQTIMPGSRPKRVTNSIYCAG